MVKITQNTFIELFWLPVNEIWRNTTDVIEIPQSVNLLAKRLAFTNIFPGGAYFRMFMKGFPYKNTYSHTTLIILLHAVTITRVNEWNYTKIIWQTKTTLKFYTRAASSPSHQILRLNQDLKVEHSQLWTVTFREILARALVSQLQILNFHLVWTRSQ